MNVSTCMQFFGMRMIVRWDEMKSIQFSGTDADGWSINARLYETLLLLEDFQKTVLYCYWGLYPCVLHLHQLLTSQSVLSLSIIDLTINITQHTASGGSVGADDQQINWNFLRFRKLDWLDWFTQDLFYTEQ